MPEVSVNETNLYYEVYGEGVPILGIHGTPSSSLLWVDAARELASLGRCIIYDRRGFLRSQRSDPFDSVDLATQVDDAVALLRALSASQAVVIGRSTGGLIALELAHLFPDVVLAVVLLEPAVFSVDPEAEEWAGQLRDRILERSREHPEAAAEIVLREALGDEMWDSLPEDLRQMFAGTSAAVLAEMRGRGLDLSAEPLTLSEDELASIGHPVLLVSAEDSPDVLRRVNNRLAEALPRAETAVVTGGHLINPAHPAVLDFVGRVLEGKH